MTLAAALTPIITTATITNVIGSCGFTPQRNDSTRRAATIDSAPPAITPVIASAMPESATRLAVFSGEAPKRVHIEPGGVEAQVTRHEGAVEVACPPVEVHSMVVAEW